MPEWNDFYVAVSGASAALTGLLFVGISINLTKILSISGLPDRALLSLVLLLNVLIISLLFLVPHSSPVLLGTAVLLVGALSCIIVSLLDFRVFITNQNPYRRKYLLNILINQVATLLFVGAGVALLLNSIYAPYWLVPAILLSVVKAVAEGWVLLVEINR